MLLLTRVNVENVCVFTHVCVCRLCCWVHCICTESLEYLIIDSNQVHLSFVVHLHWHIWLAWLCYCCSAMLCIDTDVWFRWSDCVDPAIYIWRIYLHCSCNGCSWSTAGQQVPLVGGLPLCALLMLSIHIAARCYFWIVYYVVHCGQWCQHFYTFNVFFHIRCINTSVFWSDWCLCSPSSINWYRLRLGVKCNTGAVLGMLAAIIGATPASFLPVVAVVQWPWSDLSLMPLYKL